MLTFGKMPLLAGDTAVVRGSQWFSARVFQHMPSAVTTMLVLWVLLLDDTPAEP
jgi:hypothetical protein